MNILVTVGTTEFSELVKCVDLQIAGMSKYNIEAQIGNSSYVPQNMLYYDYTDNLSERIEHADIIITHGGAGTVYNLLERQKKTIVVPNPKVRANHQVEIARFVEQNNFAQAVFNLNNLLVALVECEKKVFSKYVNSNKKLIDNLVNLIKMDN